MAEEQKSVHQKFAEVLEALGTNAYQVSKRLGLNSPDKYYKIEKGQVKPSFDTLAQIISLYPQVNINYYFKENTPMFEDPQPSYTQTSASTDDLSKLRIKHLEQKVAMLEAQNQELTTKLFGK